MPTNTVLEGPLSKWTNMLSGWQYRWFVLDPLNGLLSYYTSKENMSKGERRGCIRLNKGAAYVGYDNEDDITFTITVDEKTFHLQARNLDEREKWVNKIDRTIRYHATASSTSGTSDKSQLLNDDMDADLDADPLDMTKFDSQLAESDAYLQLLIEQLKGLEMKRMRLLQAPDASIGPRSPDINILDPNLNSFDGNSTSTSEHDESYSGTDDEKLQSIISATESLIETLKHAIICLQIAKANSDPNSNVGELANDLNEVMSNFNKSQSQPNLTPSESLNNSFRANEPVKPQTGSAGASGARNDESAIRKKLHSLSQLQPLTEEQPEKKESKKSAMGDPVKSYSSSDDDEKRPSGTVANEATFKNIVDDDDDEENLSDYFNDEDDDDEASYRPKSRTDDNDSENFYDAIDPTVTVTSYSSITTTTTNSSEKAMLSRFDEAKSKSDIADDSSTRQPSTQQELSARGLIMIDNKLVSDNELYDDDALPEDVDLNNQQSVITHLLTQVRIGMDLTKITLPTFILEPRSLLEMYADFFAHTDIFLEIVEKKNAHDRMLQVMKWYLSTLHAGRKSPVAKKPYNPILGEIFQCWYNVPQLEAAGGDRVLANDGPVKWSTRDQLAFIAEQVSHHPPISAFYAEHYNKRIQIDGYTWTKSKFLGLSIGVHFVGKAVLSLLDFDEEYVMTFPSAYGRSILTVPWFEIGGQVSVSCAKTGYSSNIEFLTKPFYGGKKHQIQGTISGPDKKTLYTIDGDWNGTMFIKGTKKEVLIATQSTPTIRKLVRPLVDQSDNESRRLWREVTYFLRTKQIDRATSAKQKIEHMQREMVKYRKENNIKWQPDSFVEDGENWVYVNPLVRRLANK